MQLSLNFLECVFKRVLVLVNNEFTIHKSFPYDRQQDYLLIDRLIHIYCKTAKTIDRTSYSTKTKLKR